MILRINTTVEQELIEITADVRQVVEDTGIRAGFAVVYVPTQPPV